MNYKKFLQNIPSAIRARFTVPMDEGYAAYEDTLNRLYVVCIGVFVTLSVLVFRILDPLFVFNENLNAVFIRWRLTEAGIGFVCAILLQIFFRQKYVVRIMSVLGILAMITLSGWFFAPLGGVTAPWIHGGSYAPFVTACMLISFPKRVFLTLLFPVAYFGAFFVFDPAYLDNPLIFVPLGWTLFGASLSIAIGSILRFLARRDFEQSIRITRHANELEQMNQSLEETIARRTGQLRRLVVVRDRETEKIRTQVARDLHDDLGQHLAALKLNLGLLKMDIDEELPVEDRIDGLQSVTSSIIDGVRKMIVGMQPDWIVQEGLVSGIRQMLQRLQQSTEAAICFEAGDQPLTFDLKQTVALYRVIGEACVNAVRHSQAKSISVVFETRDNFFVFRVKDDGCGFDPAAENEGVGLISMSERMERLGGKLEITSQVGQSSILGKLALFK